MVWFTWPAWPLALWALWRHAPGVPAAGTAPAGNPFATFVVPLATSRFRWLLAVFALLLRRAHGPDATRAPL